MRPKKGVHKSLSQTVCSGKGRPLHVLGAQLFHANLEVVSFQNKASVWPHPVESMFNPWGSGAQSNNTTSLLLLLVRHLLLVAWHLLLLALGLCYTYTGHQTLDSSLQAAAEVL